MAVATFIFETLTQRLSVAATVKSNAFAYGIMPLVGAGLTLYITIMAIAVMRGAIQQPVMEVLWRVIKMMLICAILFASGVYGEYVVGALESLRDGLTGIAGGGPVYRVIDTMTSRIFDVSVKAFPQNGILSAGFWEAIATAACFLVAQVIITVAALIPLIMSYVYFYVGMMIGPVAIACALFPPTQKIFDSWLSSCLIAMGTNVVVALLVALLSGFMEGAVAQADQAFTSGTFAPLSIGLDFFLITVVLGFVTWKAGDLAAQLLGGVSSYNPMDRVAMDGLKQSGSMISKAVTALRLKLGAGGSVKK